MELGKFKVKWVRSYKICEVGDNGAIKLWTLDGMEVLDPINVSRLKKCKVNVCAKKFGWMERMVY